MSDQVPATTRQFRLTPATNAHAAAEDQLSTELDAIITIGRALSHIPDAETRTRVMRWAIDRFGIDVTPPVEEPGADLQLPANVLQLPANAGPAVPKDFSAAEGLNVDGLSDMFPADDDRHETHETDFTSSRRREPARKATAADRLRDVLHWMGI